MLEFNVYQYFYLPLGPRLNECKGLPAGNRQSGQTFPDQKGAPNDPSRNSG